MFIGYDGDSCGWFDDGDGGGEHSQYTHIQIERVLWRQLMPLGIGGGGGFLS